MINIDFRRDSENMFLRSLHACMIYTKVHLTNNRYATALRDWSLITGRGKLQNGKIADPELFSPPPLKTE